MTENSAISAFGLTSARLNTVRERVGGGPGLRRTPKSRKLGLNRRPPGECRVDRFFAIANINNSAQIASTYAFKRGALDVVRHANTRTEPSANSACAPIHIANAGNSSEVGQQKGRSMKNDVLKLIATAITLVVGLTAAQAQTTAGPNRPATVPARYVITPFGYYDPSCVVRLAQGDELLPDQGVIRHADGSTVNMRQCAYPHYRADGTPVYGDERGVKDPNISHAWIDAAPVTTSSSYGGLHALWSVPPTPASNDNQTLFFFPGLEDISDTVTILQPVLAWNNDFASAWSIASWNCCEKGTTYEGKPQHASPGDTILGYMWDTCAAGTLECSSWDIVTADLQNGLNSGLTKTSNFKQTFNWAFAGVLEVYGVKRCSDYPNQPNGVTGGSNALTFGELLLYNDKFQQITNPAWAICKPGSTGATCPILLSPKSTPQCSYGGSLPQQVILTF